MKTMIPWKHKQAELSGNGSELSSLRDFPTFLRRMQNEFQELMDRFSKDYSLASDGDGWRWGVNLEEKDDCILIRAEAPGFEADDFDIQVTGNRLTLRATHKSEAKAKSSTYHEQRECYESMNLPTGVNADKIDACYHSGVLTLTIPKTAEFKAKKISVKST
jgi:HSP20 family protein